MIFISLQLEAEPTERRHRRRLDRGFSLIELLVAVAVIGILATIAMPMFQNYSARARQSEAKSALTGIFAVEKAFQAENGYHTGCLKTMGYSPESGGRHYYTVGFSKDFSGSGLDPTKSYLNCDTSLSSNIPDETWFKANAFAPPVAPLAVQLATAAEIPLDSGVDSRGFLVYAVGRVGFDKNFDYWSIDHHKNLIVSNKDGTSSLYGAAILGCPTCDYAGVPWWQ